MSKNHYDTHNAYWDESKNDWVEYEIGKEPLAIRFPFWLFRAMYDCFIRPITRIFR